MLIGIGHTNCPVRNLFILSLTCDISKLWYFLDDLWLETSKTWYKFISWIAFYKCIMPYNGNLSRPKLRPVRNLVLKLFILTLTWDISKLWYFLDDIWLETSKTWYKFISWIAFYKCIRPYNGNLSRPKLRPVRNLVLKLFILTLTCRGGSTWQDTNAGLKICTYWKRYIWRGPPPI